MATVIRVKVQCTRCNGTGRITYDIGSREVTRPCMFCNGGTLFVNRVVTKEEKE